MNFYEAFIHYKASRPPVEDNTLSKIEDRVRSDVDLRAKVGQLSFDTIGLPKITLSDQKLAEMKEILLNYDRTNDGKSVPGERSFQEMYYKLINETFEERMAKIVLSRLENCSLLNEDLRETLKNKRKEDKYLQMLRFRENLPSFKKKRELLRLIDENQIVVISGETGCGKTTQIAQYVLDDYIAKDKGSLCKIVCTQPRRISAVSVAERVAAERNEKLGESVGYQIRMDKVLPKRNSGSLVYVTTGILLQWILVNPSLDGISHLFLDEVHERDFMCDFVVTFLKLIVPKRPDLKIVLMSATIKAEDFSEYFGGVPCITIPGFTFSVEEIYLEQILMLRDVRMIVPRQRFARGHENSLQLQKERNFYSKYIVPYVDTLKNFGLITPQVCAQLRDKSSEELNTGLICSVISYICRYEEDGAILVFLPGLDDINLVGDTLEETNNSEHIIYRLHSSFPTDTQREVFTRPPPGVRKIVIATNIAETSITIDDVVYVIDCGYSKQLDFNKKIKVSTLHSEFISLANAKQRRGRAGRVQPGKCFKLYTRAREDLFRPYPLPEMKRKCLEEVILQTKLLQLGRVAPFLDKLMDPPDPDTVLLSLQKLQAINALDEDEKLTPLGYHLAKLPLEPGMGKMVLMGALFGCVDPILSIAAVFEFKDPFYIPHKKMDDVKRTKLEFVNYQPSDHLVISSVISQWEIACEEGCGSNFAKDNFLSIETLNHIRSMKDELAHYLYEMNFLATSSPRDQNGNENCHNTELIKALICAGLYPNVAKYVNNIREKRKNIYVDVIGLKTVDHPEVRFHPSPTVCNSLSSLDTSDSPFFVYYKILSSRSYVFIHDATMVHHLPLLFFGGDLNMAETTNSNYCLQVDKMVKFVCSKRDATVIQDLRIHLDRALLGFYSNPEPVNWEHKSIKVLVLRAVVQLITEQEKPMGPSDYRIFNGYASKTKNWRM